MTGLQSGWIEPQLVVQSGSLGLRRGVERVLQRAHAQMVLAQRLTARPLTRIAAHHQTMGVFAGSGTHLVKLGVGWGVSP